MVDPIAYSDKRREQVDRVLSLETDGREMVALVERTVKDLLALEPEFHETGVVPGLAATRFQEMGLFGIGVPEAYGGLELDPLTSILIQIELAKLPPQFWPLLRSALGPSIKTLVNSGTSAQKERWLPSIAAGNCAVGIAMTEPQAGSDVSAIKTAAGRVDEGYVINGTKMFISNASEVDLFTVFAYTNPDGGTKSGITAFLVPRETPGLQVSPPIPTMGWVKDGVYELSLDDCFVPEENRLGQEGEGFRQFYRCLNEGRLSVGAQALGAAKMALSQSIDYAKERSAFGQVIGQFQAIQHTLADIDLEVRLSEVLLLDTVDRFRDGTATGADCSRVKLFCSESAGRVADAALQIHGGNGYCRGTVVERIFRDVRVLRIYDGTSEIHRNIIAKELLR